MINKWIALLLGACLIAAVFMGCSKQNRQEPEESQEVSQSDDPSRPESLSDEEAAQQNAMITDDQVELVQFEDVKPDDPIAVINTSEGAIRIRLFPEYAPLAVQNFVTHAQNGYFNGLQFHRVVEDFMVQTGDPTAAGTGGQSIWAEGTGDKGYFADEFSLNLWHFRGAVAMANTGDPDTNSSQFYVVQRPDAGDALLEQMREVQFPNKVLEKYEELGGTPTLDWRHTVFGMVIEGMEVVDDIAAVDTDENDKPLEPIIIESVTIENAPAYEQEADDGDETTQ